MEFEFVLDEPRKTELYDVSHLLNNVTSTLLMKMEAMQYTESHKYRLAHAMMTDVLRNRPLDDIDGFVECSSGNTGLALAKLTNDIDRPLRLIINRSLSPEMRKEFEQYPNVTLQTAIDGNDAYAAAMDFELLNPRWVHLNQYDNAAGILGFEQMSREIVEQTPNGFDSFVMGVGTGATISGMARVNSAVRIIACTIDDDFGSIEGWKNLAIIHPGGVLISASERNYMNTWRKFTISEIVRARNSIEEKLGFKINLSTVGNLLAAIEEGDSYNDQTIVTVCTGYDQ